MTSRENPLDQPIRSHDDLVALFAAAEKPASEFRIGPEMEKPGVFADTLLPIPYRGPASVLRILEEFESKHGWKPDPDYADPLLALVREGASITLEPGGQLELSGAAVRSVHEVCAELRRHMRELAPISKELGIVWLGVGFHPFARREDFDWIPKPRYPVMREYLPTRGGHALDMMLRTSTVQANFDYASEKDAMRKMRAALALSPVTTAIFANSPWKEHAPHGGVTYRGRVWLDVDPDRTGLLPPLWKRDAGYVDYVEWALDAPMFLFKRGHDYVMNTGQTFRSFWKSGFEGHKPTFGDWQMHLNTLFPEVRLKRTIEVRGADAQATAMACALPALWTGILYDDRALAEAEALTADHTHEEAAQLRESIWREGLRAKFRGKPLAELAQRVVEIGEGGLERRAIKDANGRDERVHLARIKDLVARGKCPADLLLDGIEPGLSREELDRAIVKRASLRTT